MADEHMFIFDENGVAHEYDHTFDVTVHCKSEQESEHILDLLNTGKRMQWIDVNDTKKLPQHEKPYIVSLTSIDSGKSENAFAKYDCELDIWQLCDDCGTLFGPDGTAYYSPDMNAELTHWMEQPLPPKKEQDNVSEKQ